MKYIKIFFRSLQFLHILIHEAVHALATLTPVQVIKTVQVGGKSEDNGSLVLWPWDDGFKAEGAVWISGEWIMEHCKGLTHALIVFIAPVIVELTFTMWAVFWVSRNWGVFFGVLLGSVAVYYFLRAAHNDLLHAEYILNYMLDNSAGGK